MIFLNVDVPDDFEEYCEIHFQDPGDPITRSDYLHDLKCGARFKKFITQEEIRSFPSIRDKDETIEIMDLKNEHNLNLLGFCFIFLQDKKEYDKLAELQKMVEYHSKIVRSYGFDIFTGEFDTKVFPITKEDKQMKNIVQDFKNYFQVLSEYNDYLKELIKKYNIKQSGNTKKSSFQFQKEE